MGSRGRETEKLYCAWCTMVKITSRCYYSKTYNNLKFFYALTSIETNTFSFLAAKMGSKTVLRIHLRETLMLTLVGGLKIMVSNVSTMITRLGTFVSTQMEQWWLITTSVIGQEVQMVSNFILILRKTNDFSYFKLISADLCTWTTRYVMNSLKFHSVKIIKVSKKKHLIWPNYYSLKIGRRNFYGRWNL